MGIPVSDRKCNFCDKDLGNEFHYLLNCQYFKDRRIPEDQWSCKRSPDILA